MRWHWIVVTAAFLCPVFLSGCRSQPGWSPFCGPGSRVPPPGTGTYGTPNTYYQPGMQSVPATVPPAGARTFTTPSSQWSTVRQDDPKVTTLDTSTNFSTGTSTAVSSSPNNSSVATKLNGMPVNKVRPAIEPQPFPAPDMMTELRSTMSGTAPAGNSVLPASSTQSDNVSRSPVSTANWQTRPISSPRPVKR